jgi:hypothetical protein
VLCVSAVIVLSVVSMVFSYSLSYYIFVDLKNEYVCVNMLCLSGV